MKMTSFKTILFAGLGLAIVSCGNQQTNTNTDTARATAADTTSSVPSIKTDSVLYSSNGKQSKGYIAYDENKKGKLPVVVVIPEWWGVNDYTKRRARQLADLGYFAISADLFGNGDTAANPKEAMAFTKPFYTNPQLALTAVQSAISRAATFSQADTSRIAAIGYCFGGFIVLNAAKLGAPLKATVSFHGGLDGVQPKKDLIKGDILVCQGGADQFVPEKVQNAFKKSMDSVGAHYTFVVYPGAMHAFSNPNATALGEKFKLPIAYNGAADTASWKAMQDLFATSLK
ncbi:MAG TPA: dienelactone hydrolase family protein [Puia sp.]|nr:dienelactone hydrolase family protein [Puia sp.]